MGNQVEFSLEPSIFRTILTPKQQEPSAQYEPKL